MQNLDELKKSKIQQEQELESLEKELSVVEKELEELKLKEKGLDEEETNKESDYDAKLSQINAELESLIKESKPKMDAYERIVKQLKWESENSSRIIENVSGLQEKLKQLETDILPFHAMTDELMQNFKKIKTSIGEEVVIVKKLHNEILEKLNDKRKDTFVLMEKLKEKFHAIKTIQERIIQIQKNEVQEDQKQTPTNQTIDDFDFQIDDPGPPPLPATPFSLAVVSRLCFLSGQVDIDEFVPLLEKTGLMDEKNYERLKSFNGSLRDLYCICDVLGEIGLTQERFETITGLPEHVKNIARILEQLDKHYKLDKDLIFNDVIRYSPLADSVIGKIPNRKYYHEPSLTYEGFKEILKAVDLEIEARNKMKTAYLRDFKPKKLKDDSAMKVMATNPIADVNTSRMVFSMLFPPPKLHLRDKKSGNQKEYDLKGIEKSGDRALFLALEESPFNPKRVKALLEPNKGDFSEASLANVNAFRPSDQKSFFRVLAEKTKENPKESRYLEALQYVLQRMNALEEDETWPTDALDAVKVMETIPEFMKDNEENVKKLKDGISKIDVLRGEWICHT